MERPGSWKPLNNGFLVYAANKHTFRTEKKILFGCDLYKQFKYLSPLKPYMIGTIQSDGVAMGLHG
jgi:hypothetical protein